MAVPRCSFAVMISGSLGSPRRPTAALAASWRLPIVALIAQMRSSGRWLRNQLRQSSHWLPRLLPISSCHSSSTTASRLANSCSAALPASSTERDSGVVIRIWGGWRSWRARSALGVSPLRIPTRSGQPIASIGRRIARARSRLRARKGVR